MAKTIKIMVLRTDNPGLCSFAFRDTTVGKVYTARLLGADEADADGDICGRPAVSFRDDAGDLVLAAVPLHAGISYKVVG